MYTAELITPTCAYVYAPNGVICAVLSSDPAHMDERDTRTKDDLLRQATICADALNKALCRIPV